MIRRTERCNRTTTTIPNSRARSRLTLSLSALGFLLVRGVRIRKRDRYSWIANAQLFLDRCSFFFSVVAVVSISILLLSNFNVDCLFVFSGAHEMHQSDILWTNYVLLDIYISSVCRLNTASAIVAHCTLMFRSDFAENDLIEFLNRDGKKACSTSQKTIP